MTTNTKKARRIGTVLFILILILLIVAGILTYLIFSNTPNSDSGVFVHNSIREMVI